MVSWGGFTTMCSNKLPLVLIVEDDEDLMDVYEMSLSDRFEVIGASTVEEGKKLYEKYKDDLFAVVLDGNVHGKTSVALAREIRMTYLGHLLANSDHDRVQQELIDSGCLPHGHKWDLPDTLKRLYQE
jgi:DNA-binding NtrC family response regulator